MPDVLHVPLPPSVAPLFMQIDVAGALTWGFIGVILAELLITPTGIGDLISYNQSVAEYPAMYAAIVSIVLASVLFIGLIEFVEKTFFRPEKRA